MNQGGSLPTAAVQGDVEAPIEQNWTKATVPLLRKRKTSTL